jgi:hypothetical protein
LGDGPDRSERPQKSEVRRLDAPAGAKAPLVCQQWFSELRRRRVFRALVAYGIAAFAVLQIIEPIMHGSHWPEMVLSYVVAGLAAGFPIVISLAWVFDISRGVISSGPRPPRLAQA